MLSVFGILGLLMAGLASSGLVGRFDGASDSDADTDAAPGDASQAEAPAIGPDLSDSGGALVGDGAELGLLSYVLAESGDAAGDDETGAPGLELVGREGGDGLEGGDGDDLLRGGAGDDQLNGAAGDDTLAGEAGADTLRGGHGDDRLYGGEGDDWLAGEEGDDWLEGGAGNDTLIGGNGNDTLLAGPGNSWLAGGMGDDLLVAGDGQDTLDGDAGNDTLIGNFAGNPDAPGHYLNGGTGDDVLRIGAGDIATGGEGADRFELAHALPGGIATVMDYTHGIDDLVVVYDAAGPLPQVSLAPGPLPEDVLLLLDGQALAHIVGGAGLTPEAIRLEPR